MGLNLKFPRMAEERIAVTPMMRGIADRTIEAHPLSPLISWTGGSGRGKTTTAKMIVKELEAQYDPSNPDAFRLLHYEVGEIPRWSGHEGKKAIRSLYEAALGTLDEGTYRQSPPEGLARLLVRGLRRRNIRMVFMDEAGLLSLRAIRGVVLVRDTAVNEGWPLSIILIGMDDLCTKLETNPQVQRRIHDWCYFEEYSFNDTWKLLQKIHPLFTDLDARDPEHVEMVKFIHQKYGGVPGNFVPFLQKVDRRLAKGDVQFDLRLLRTIHFYTLRDRQRSLGEDPDIGEAANA